MKILIISDLHLCDRRNSPSFEKRRLVLLRDFIMDSGAGLVLNLGDTVSRKEFLRPEYPDLEAGYRYYLSWRRQLEVPFVECAIGREFSFFGEMLSQEPDSVYAGIPDMAVISLAPRCNDDHVFLPEQTDFLAEAIRSSSASRFLIGTHVPYPGSCSRGIAPGIFLEIPERMRSLVEKSDRPVYWCGGHFHWAEEPPRCMGSLTAFYGGRFGFESCPDKKGWLRQIDSESGQITTVLRDFSW